MSRAIRITVLVENTARGRGILGEHGLAIWIEIGSQRILFDTGQGMALSHNATELGMPLESVDHIVLSHGHYDHTGGLDHMLKAAGHPRVYAHPDAFSPKYARNDNGASRDIAIPYIDETTVRQKAENLIWTKQPTEICERLFVTGEIPRLSKFEDTGGPFFLDEKCQHPDPLADDQAVFFESAQGTVVLLGCAHAGVINTLEYVRRLTNGKPIHAVMGGMHLVSASQQRLNRTIEALRKLNVARLGPAHCTGMPATVELSAAFPERCFAWTAGCHMEFETPNTITQDERRQHDEQNTST